MDFILNRIVNFNVLNVVGVFRKESEDFYYLIKVKKSKSKIDILNTETFSDFDSITRKIEINIPVLLLIDGKGVLNKKIDLENSVDVEWVKKIDYESIHFTCVNTNKHQFFSFCRNSVSDEIINLFQKSEFQIIDIYIGSLISSILNQLLKKNKIFSNESILDFENDELLNHAKSSDTNEIIDYTIDGKSISKFHLPLYGVVIHFYLNQKNISKSSSKLINKEEIFYKKGFEYLGARILIGFFIMLLLSYGLIQFYNSKNAALNLERVYKNQSYELIEKLEEQKNKKIEIVNKTGIVSSKYISFFAYEITKSLPFGINLSFMEVYPIEGEIKNANSVFVGLNIISIKGFTQDENILNVWFSNLKAVEWIKKLEIISIKKDKKGITFFELKIYIKNV